ncbi:hypothetical protein EUGRSUZ_B02609 [Eucalyptus grandis]|uniref:Uncharacterized protein n=2 Tax=Eucalyptus grandis TaxID=71139 RepID=A0ACC3LUV7_EUCGR|nr:hypothetical protein EUGRSUZ_B02609 [Eucalyptus grandis]
MSPDGTTVFTARSPIHNSTNPPAGVPQSRPSAAYSNNGIVYLTGAQGIINNQPMYLRPNGVGAPMAAVVPQGANHGMTGGLTGTAIGGVFAGIGESVGQEICHGVTDMWRGGGHGSVGQGSMGLDGTETMNAYVGDYF